MSDSVELIGSGFDNDMTGRIMEWLTWAYEGLDALNVLYETEELDRSPLISDIEIQAAYDSLSSAIDVFALVFNVRLIPVLDD